jgi:3-oxoacyl-[acyl-carrier protein] reductase
MSEKRVALITGASRGIGKACALKLAGEGFDIVITYAGNDEAANKTVKEIEDLGVKAYAYKFDVGSKEAVEKALAEIIAKVERIDVLVNNAGITRDGLLIRMSGENWDDVISTNLSSAFYVTTPVAKLMMKQRSGSIINMSSVSGVYGNAGQANYSSAKAGLIGFTKSLAKELGSRGIRVNAVAPGFIMTDMTKDLPNIEQVAEHIPLRRLGEAEDIAQAIKFFAVDGTYVTGQVLEVSGGLVI